jgi:hypothetical protein
VPSCPAHGSRAHRGGSGGVPEVLAVVEISDVELIPVDGGAAGWIAWRSARMGRGRTPTCWTGGPSGGSTRLDRALLRGRATAVSLICVLASHPALCCVASPSSPNQFE